ncbi:MULTISPECIES: hypothetical protein [unclassified Modestobacter]
MTSSIVLPFKSFFAPASRVVFDETSSGLRIRTTAFMEPTAWRHASSPDCGHLARLTILLAPEAADKFDDFAEQCALGTDTWCTVDVTATVEMDGQVVRTAKRMELECFAGDDDALLRLPRLLGESAPTSTAEHAAVTISLADAIRLSKARALWLAGARPLSHLNLMVDALIQPSEVAGLMDQSRTTRLRHLHILATLTQPAAPGGITIPADADLYAIEEADVAVGLEWAHRH